MAGGIPKGNPDHTVGEKFLALLIVVLFATVGGQLTSLLKGLNLKKNCVCKEGFKLKPVSKTITIPVLVGIIIFGCIARNWFPQEVMEKYPNDWAAWIRTVCLSIILMRGGLELDFSNFGVTVLVLTLCP